MPKPITFQQPPKVKGYARKKVTITVDPVDMKLIKEFADQQSEASGIKVSIANVLTTAFYQQWPNIRKKKRQLEKEAHGRKHNRRP